MAFTNSLILWLCVIIIGIALIIAGSVCVHYNNKVTSIEEFIDPTEYFEKSKEYFDNKKTYSFNTFANSVKSPKIDQKDINPTVFNKSKFNYVNGQYSENKIKQFIDDINNSSDE